MTGSIVSCLLVYAYGFWVGWGGQVEGSGGY